MSLKYSNVAYDLSLFEEREEKNNVLVLPKIKVNKKRKKLEAFTFRAKVVSFGIMCIASVGAIIFSQIRLTELTDKIRLKNMELNEKASRCTQMEVEHNKNFSSDKIEALAKDLDMQKADSSQIEYINLNK